MLLKAGGLQRAIFDSADFPCIVTDARGVIQIFNVGAERMLGYTAPEVMNQLTPADISDPQDVLARACALSAEFGTPITPGFEALVFKASRGIEDIYAQVFFRKDGTRFPAVVSVTALRDAEDAIIGYLLIGTDPSCIGAAPPLRPLRILLAEDSPDNCTIILAYLADTPYTVDIAENGAIACEMFRAHPYDLVLMDRRMPVMDGLTATAAIRAWERQHARAPSLIIALTASALKGDQEICMAAGCTAFLAKPIKQAELLSAIKHHSALMPDKAAVAAGATRVGSSEAKLAGTFIANARRNLVIIQAALDTADFRTISALGHGLRGAGGMFGYPALTDIGAEIELSADKGNEATARRWVNDLSAFLKALPDPAC